MQLDAVNVVAIKLSILAYFTYLPSETLKEAVDRSEKRAQLEKQITMLQGKIRKEKQLNMQMKLSAEVKTLKKELEELK